MRFVAHVYMYMIYLFILLPIHVDRFSNRHGAAAAKSQEKKNKKIYFYDLRYYTIQSEHIGD